MNLNDLALLQKYFDYTDILNSKESEELNRTELNKKTNDEKKLLEKL